jgi:predicted HAD superfamily phosphohydrolase YqeG
LPPISGNKEYTLVLDLDETLIHFDCDEERNEDDEGRESDEEE